MPSARTKYLEPTTGQVGYLSQTDAGTWIFELYMGGPDPDLRVQELESREEMEEWLQAAGFRRAEP